MLLLDVRPKSAFDAEHLSCAVHFHPTCLQRFTLLSAGMSQPRAERLAAALTLGMMWMESRDVQNLIPCQVVQGPSRAATLWDWSCFGTPPGPHGYCDQLRFRREHQIHGNCGTKIFHVLQTSLLKNYCSIFSTQTCQEQANCPCEVSTRNMDES